MQLLTAVTEFECSQPFEHTQSRLVRMTEEGKKLGRKPSYNQEQAELIKADTLLATEASTNWHQSTVHT